MYINRNNLVDKKNNCCYCCLNNVYMIYNFNKYVYFYIV